jgi:hypothetical protein
MKHWGDRFINSRSPYAYLKAYYYMYKSILYSRARSIDLLLLVLCIVTMLDVNLSILLLTLSAVIILRSIVLNLTGVYFSLKVYKEEADG